MSSLCKTTRENAAQRRQYTCRMPGTKVGRTPKGFSFPHRLKQRRLRPFTHTLICLANLRGNSSPEGWKSVESRSDFHARTESVFFHASGLGCHESRCAVMRSLTQHCPSNTSHLVGNATTVTLRWRLAERLVSHSPSAEGFRSICITTDRAP
jgi:hypothetical protein